MDLQLRNATPRPDAAAAKPAGHDAQPTDAALVELIRSGDTKAGEILVRRYVESLMRYLRRISGNDHAAEELHQQTWLSVLEHLDKFDPEASSGGFKAWLFRIATNKANDIWRSRQRETAAKHGMRLVTESEAPDASHRMAETQEQHKLLNAIEQLPEQQRQVLMLRYYSEMKFIEIASVLGCPLNTALGRMHKAMLKLKDLMSEDSQPNESVNPEP